MGESVIEEGREGSPQISSLVLNGFHAFYLHAGYHSTLAFGHHPHHRVIMDYFNLG